MIAAILPAAASAAECTDTWVGAAEGSWSWALNWSAGHVPTSVDVACIGSGKTPKVSAAAGQAAIVQGEGGLLIWGSSLELTSTTEASKIKSLTISGNGTLKGAGTLYISSTFSWAEESTMSGTGSTVIMSGATGSSGAIGGQRRLTQRRLINEGTYTWSAGSMAESEGAEIVNAGTFNANAEAGITAGTGKSLFVNKGTLRKTAGTGTTSIRVKLENEGTASAQAGKLAFYGGGSSTSAGNWEASEGSELRFVEGSYTLSGGTLSGAVAITYNIGGASVTVEGVEAKSATVEVRAGELIAQGSSPTTFKSLILTGNCVFKGAGTVNILSTFSWAEESTMSGTGSTVIMSGATGSSGAIGGQRRLTQRRLINEGTYTWTTGWIAMSEGAEILNTGTFNANAENGITSGSGKPSLFVNTGLLRKTAGTGTTTISAGLTTSAH